MRVPHIECVFRFDPCYQYDIPQLIVVLFLVWFVFFFFFISYFLIVHPSLAKDRPCVAKDSYDTTTVVLLCDCLWSPPTPPHYSPVLLAVSLR